MNQSDIDDMLQQSLTDGKLSRAEKATLRAILTNDAEDNEENIVVTNDQRIVRAFGKQFELLWPQMAPVLG